MKAVWILINNKLSSTKGGSDPTTRNPFWKFVIPQISYFAWLPAGIAHAFCAEALATIPQAQYADPTWSYYNLEEFEGPKNTKRGFGVPAVLHGLTPLGDTRNSQELSVFCNMPKERRRCCMFFILWLSCLTGTHWPLRLALPWPLALLTGRTDLCSAGVFGAGKTRAAAAVIVGLIAIDPTLSIMICTKENAAAQAVAEHIVSMKLPEDLLSKFGRLIGFHEAQKGASARTAIDVGSQNRNQASR